MDGAADERHWSAASSIVSCCELIKTAQHCFWHNRASLLPYGSIRSAATSTHKMKRIQLFMQYLEHLFAHLGIGMKLLRGFDGGMGMLTVAAALLILSRTVTGHGYLKSPRSRNYRASKSVWWPYDEEAPRPESDVQSLNTGGTVARCGKSPTVNYDTPPNNKGTTLPNQIQASYQEGSLIDLVVVLSAHHKGHFVYKACPISPGEVPTQACFDQHPLQFVDDNLYGGVPDPNYPERAYLPPEDLPGTITDPSDVPGKKYSHKYRLPPGLVGSIVLIQWHYITGYASYAWPHGWENQYQNTLCPPLTASGGSFAEQFWNCAEVEITLSSSSSSTTTTTSATLATTTSSTSSSTTTTRATASLKPVGMPCEMRSECASGSCFGTCECRRDSDCKDNEICSIAGNGSEQYVFVCTEVLKPAGEACLLPSQCESCSCFKSVCECRSDADCGDGESCQMSEGQHVCSSTAFLIRRKA